MFQMYVYSCLLSALSLVEMKSLNVKGHVGKSVTVACSDWTSWSNVEQNVKYFCNSPCLRTEHIIAKAAFEKTERKDRIQLNNSVEGLFVTFTNLKKSDSNTYYCGVEKFGIDSFIKVNLEVTDDESSRIKTTPNTVIVAPTLDFAFDSHINTHMPTSDVIHSTTSSSSATGSVLYSIIGVLIVVMTILMLLLKLMRKMMKKQLKEEDTQEDAEYDEIRPEDQQTVRQPTGVSTVSRDPDSLYANCPYRQVTELAACAESRVVDPQSELLYSVVQLPKAQTELPRQLDPNHSESNENDFLYSLVQLPEAT